MRLDVEDDPGDWVVVGGIRSELDLGKRDSSESDDDECSRCGDAGNVFHRDFLLRCRQKLVKLTGGESLRRPSVDNRPRPHTGSRSRLAIWTALQK